MKMLKREVVGAGTHYSGWPRVMQAIGEIASGDGTLLDDYADATFSYQPQGAPHDAPWVGVFHNPVHITSPIASDLKHELRGVSRHWNWQDSVSHLKGGVALCLDVAAELRTWLDIPTLSIWHPSETNVLPWRYEAAMEARQLVQAGFYLRNTQLIFQVAPPGWRRLNLFGAPRWARSRDRRLRRKSTRPAIDRINVEMLGRLCNEEYDQLFSRSIIITEFHGAAANNLVVECMMRGTPIVVNRLPSVEEYLGSDYPLFFETLEDVASLLDSVRLADASVQLRERAQKVPTFDEFATRVKAFVDQLEVSECP